MSGQTELIAIDEVEDWMLKWKIDFETIVNVSQYRIYTNVDPFLLADTQRANT